MASTPASEWIEWSGGECPVSDSALVKVCMGRETVEDGEREEAHPAGEFDWSAGPDGDLIRRFKVVG